MTMNPDPQQGGLLGFFQRMRKPNEQTGLSPFQRFGAALDPLILPQMRAGQQIREQGAQRVAQGNKNKTIQFLQQKASQGDTVAAQILAGLENNSLSVKDAMSLYYNQVFAKPKGITAKDMIGMQSTARKEFTGLQRVKDFDSIASAYGRIVASVQDPSPAGDLSLIFNYMKMLDPGSVVCESEFAAAAAAGSYGDRLQGFILNIRDGTKLAPAQRADFVNRANLLYGKAEGLYDETRGEYIQYAEDAGLGGEKILPDFRFKGDKLGTPTILQIPATPDGYTDERWTETWRTQPEQWRKDYLAALDQ